MTNHEATKLANLIRNGSLESAIMVIKYLGIMYKSKNGKRKRPKYTWEIKHNRDENTR